MTYLRWQHFARSVRREMRFYRGDAARHANARLLRVDGVDMRARDYTQCARHDRSRSAALDLQP